MVSHFHSLALAEDLKRVIFPLLPSLTPSVGTLLHLAGLCAHHRKMGCSANNRIHRIQTIKYKMLAKKKNMQYIQEESTFPQTRRMRRAHKCADAKQSKTENAIRSNTYLILWGEQYQTQLLLFQVTQNHYAEYLSVDSVISPSKRMMFVSWHVFGHFLFTRHSSCFCSHKKRDVCRSSMAVGVIYFCETFTNQQHSFFLLFLHIRKSTANERISELRTFMMPVCVFQRDDLT